MTREIRMLTVAMLLCVVSSAGLVGCDDDDGTNPVDREAPPIPTGVYTITGDGSVEIRWSPLVGADVAGYEIYSALTDAPQSAYDEIGRVLGEESDSFRHTGIANGVTRYYAVAAFDFDGNRSALSSAFVLVHDTPRPAGTGLRAFAPSASFNQAAIDWSRYAGGNSALIVPYDDTLADFILEEGTGADIGRLFMIGTNIAEGPNLYRNQIQDFGYTQSLDEVDWAPDNEDEATWAQSVYGVEMIAGHSYIVWTWDDYYAKFRVTNVSATSVTIDWAYQATDEFDFRFELAPGRKGGVR
ncbi:MAG: hypothetical protein ACKVU1_04290 [bacterium]